VLVASTEKARRELGWTPRHSGLENIMATAWRWHQRMRR
jgi:UDP-glucose 4-epimerase